MADLLIRLQVIPARYKPHGIRGFDANLRSRLYIGARYSSLHSEVPHRCILSWID